MTLTKEEKEILDSVESGEWCRISNFEEEATRYRRAAEATLKQNKRVNIRMTGRDLIHIQRAAMREGLSYQALIGSILHKYINGRLVEKVGQKNRKINGHSDKTMPEIVTMSEAAFSFFEAKVLASVLGSSIAAILSWFFWRSREKLFLWLASSSPVQRFALWRYRHRLRKRYGRMDEGDVYWRYIGGKHPPPLKEQFVPIKLERYRESEFEPDLPQNLLILGEPGSGKSTLLQAMMLGDGALIHGIRLNDSDKPSSEIPLQKVYDGLDRRIPIRVDLRDFQQDASNSFGKWLLTRKDLEALPYLKNERLKKAKLLLLLDGLNEVDRKHIDGVIHSITDFLKNDADDCRAIITCRERSYDDRITTFPRELGFARYRIRRIDNRDIEEIARRRLTGIDDKKPEDFLDRVRILDEEPDIFHATGPSSSEDHRVAKLLQTPLLLTLALGAYVRNSEIPNNLARFFQDAIGELLRRESETEGEKKCKRDLLRRVALECQSKAGSGGFNESSLFEKAKRSGSCHGVAPERFETLFQEITQSGLISPKPDDDKVVYEFSHPTFREFLAAERLVDVDKKNHQKGMARLMAHAGEREWLQTGIYYSSLGNNPHARDFVSALLDKSPFGDPKRIFILGMAGLCASVLANGEREEIEHLQKEVVERLRREIDQHDDEPRQLVVGLMSIARGGMESARKSANRALSDAVPPEDVVREIHWLGVGIARIGLLWDSLWEIYRRRDRDILSISRACGQLLDLMTEENGLERLAKLPRHYDRPPLSEDPDLAPENVRSYYPFVKWGRLPNLAYLIIVAVLARLAIGALRPDWRRQDHPWWALFFAATGEKNKREQGYWKNLLEDKEREDEEKRHQGFFRKLIRISPAFFGWFMTLIPLSGGLGLSILWARNAGWLENIRALDIEPLYPIGLGLGIGLVLFAVWRLIWCPLMRRLERGSGVCRLWAGQGTGNKWGEGA